MAIGALIASTVIGIGSSLIAGEGQRKAASGKADSQRRQAEQAAERFRRESAIAAQKLAIDTSMARERTRFETAAARKEAGYVEGQLTKQEMETRAAAKAGYAGSGITVGEGGSALAILNRITSESESMKGELFRRLEVFESGKELELDQFTQSAKTSYDWFISRQGQETEWEMQNRYAGGEAYDQQGKYAQWGGYLGGAGAALGGYGKAASGSYGKFK